eukprot:4368379-Lingulodinium_polyedra.AAC.1
MVPNRAKRVAATVPSVLRAPTVRKRIYHVPRVFANRFRNGKALVWLMKWFVGLPSIIHAR